MCCRPRIERIVETALAACLLAIGGGCAMDDGEASIDTAVSVGAGPPFAGAVFELNGTARVAGGEPLAWVVSPPIVDRVPSLRIELDGTSEHLQLSVDDFHACPGPYRRASFFVKRRIADGACVAGAISVTAASCTGSGLLPRGIYDDDLCGAFAATP